MWVNWHSAIVHFENSCHNFKMSIKVLCHLITIMQFLYGNEEQIEKRLSDDGDFECDNFPFYHILVLNSNIVDESE